MTTREAIPARPTELTPSKFLKKGEDKKWWAERRVKRTRLPEKDVPKGHWVLYFPTAPSFWCHCPPDTAKDIIDGLSKYRPT